MQVNVDRRIYSDSVISKVVYWLSKNYTIRRRMADADEETLLVESKVGGLEAYDVFEKKLMDALNDFKLREIVAKETIAIKTLLYAKAFAEDEDLREEDIHG